MGSRTPRKKKKKKELQICCLHNFISTRVTGKAAAEGRNGKDNTIYDSEAKFTTTKDLHALFIGQAGTTALKPLCSHVLAALL